MPRSLFVQARARPPCGMRRRMSTFARHLGTSVAIELVLVTFAKNRSGVNYEPNYFIAQAGAHRPCRASGGPLGASAKRRTLPVDLSGEREQCHRRDQRE